MTDALGESLRITTVYDGTACVPPEDWFRRGDANDDGAFDMSDAIVILNCVFQNKLCSWCVDAMDANDDGELDMSDAVYLINWRFRHGEAPPAPFPVCGEDTTEDENIGCAYLSC